MSKNIKQQTSHSKVYYCCGEYRSRTDDLLNANQALQPAELIPQIAICPVQTVRQQPVQKTQLLKIPKLKIVWCKHHQQSRAGSNCRPLHYQCSSNQLSYETSIIIKMTASKTSRKQLVRIFVVFLICLQANKFLQKGGVPAAPSGTATLLRLNPSHQFYPRSLLAVTNFRHPQLPWFDGRCVQGPGTYSPDHG